MWYRGLKKETFWPCACTGKQLQRKGRKKNKTGHYSNIVRRNILCICQRLPRGQRDFQHSHEFQPLEYRFRGGGVSVYFALLLYLSIFVFVPSFMILF